MQYTTDSPPGDLIISHYYNLQTINYLNTSIGNSNDNTVFIDLGFCMINNSNDNTGFIDPGFCTCVGVESA